MRNMILLRKRTFFFLGDNLYTGLSVAKECNMIPSNVNIAVITATPSTEIKRAEIKIEPTLGHKFNVSDNTQNTIYAVVSVYFLTHILKSVL